METDTRTNRKIPHSSLLTERMEFKIPKGWQDLTQGQLRYVISLYNIYDGREDMMQMITMAALFHFMGCRVDSQTKDGILCYRVSTGETFLLNPEFLPDMITTVEWVKRPNEMRCRLAVLHHCEAVSFDLRDLMFGNYLVCENYYQAWMLSHDWTKLSPMLDILYHDPDGGKMVKTQFDYVSVAMWWTAVKDYFGQLFPHFYRRTGEGEEITQDVLREYTDAQIRLLTKGDVTKEEYILNKTTTLRALTELDAQARESEELKRIMQKNK